MSLWWKNVRDVFTFKKIIVRLIPAQVKNPPRCPARNLGSCTNFPSGESDEGAHPHDGLELEDGKGFVAVGRADL